VDVGLRRSTVEDRDLLFQVYASTRSDIAQAPWDEGTKAVLLRVQAHAQDADYRMRWPEAEFLVVTVDGQDAGRLYRVCSGRELRLMDIALLPEWRGRGIGTTLIEGLVDEARSDGRLLSLHVEHGSPARRLYDRLGFVAAGQSEVHVRMELRPS
jgi:GNAT superfamily N-acetyltransferase